MINLDCKQMQKQCEDKVIILKDELRQINGKKKRIVEQEIEKYCSMNKQILTITNQIEMINKRYKQKVHKQHIQTGKRRDFIAEYFGERGRRWKERMYKRTVLRKDEYNMRGKLH
ncbi:MAG: hypothetical protein HFI34_03260 [Lachnospiraceae bacterium]|nr:hypothetical protein [Lachnospiraceae bacterium]